MVPGVYTRYVGVLAWISNTLPRPPAKRIAALAAINAVSNTSSIYASYLYLESPGPRYGELHDDEFGRFQQLTPIVSRLL